VHINRVKIHLPADGEVRIIKITDKQFGRIEVFYGKKRQPIEKAPEQLSFWYLQTFLSKTHVYDTVIEESHYSNIWFLRFI
jgi:CRISPR/Cas system-associated protein endoribonuclease Cas2